MSRATLCALVWSANEQVYEIHVAGRQDAQPLLIESAAWFVWLEQTASFAFRGQAGSYTARKERRSAGDAYWYAYTRVSGKLAKRYLGRCIDLNAARLEQVARALHPLLPAQAKTDPPQQGESADLRASNDAHLASTTSAGWCERSLAPLLATKLHLPRPRARLLPRLLLQEKLSQGLTHTLTLLVAPAGFGKTTAVSSWLRAAPVVPIWLSLESDDNELNRFWFSIFSAFNVRYPKVCQSLLEQLQFTIVLQPTPIELLLITFINGLVGVTEKIVLALDDYHTITDPMIHASIVFLLEHLPATIHVVIGTRAEPPLPLARWRAGNFVLDLRATDLRFTLDEVESFLHTIMGLPLSAKEVILLEERTAGWPALLQLVSLSLHERPQHASISNIINKNQRSIVAYLAEEVLLQQPSHIQDFLLTTSLLARLHGDLCDAVTDRANGQEMLIYLEEANFFVNALDETHTWYRYHQLFAHFLAGYLRTTAPERIPLLHERAARWYEEQGYLTEALHHWSEMRDGKLLASFLEKQCEHLIKQGEFTLLRQGIARLPVDCVKTQPWLALAQAKTLAFLGQLDAAEQFLQEIDANFAAGMNPALASLRGELLATQALVAGMRLDTTRAITLARQALACLPQESVFIRNVLALSLGNAYRVHDTEAASRALEEAMRLAENPHMVVLSMCQFAFQLYLQGQLHRAFELYQRALECAPVEQRLPAKSIALLGCGEIEREWNHLDVAERLLEEALPLGREWTFPGITTGIVVTMALVKQALGDGVSARALLHQQFHYAEQQGELVSLATIRAYRALLDHMENSVAVRLWAVDFASNLYEKPLEVVREREYLTLAAIQIAHDQFMEADTLLVHLLTLAEADNRMRGVIAILILQALLEQRQGRINVALNTLARALELAEPEGYIRLFADHGTALAALLRCALRVRRRNNPLLAHSFTLAYAQKILRAAEQARLPVGKVMQGPLSKREYEVACLIAAGLSNEQIAQRLIVALSTVKWYVKQIYNKLNVANRAQLLTDMRERGWL